MSEQYSRFCPHINRSSAVCSIMATQNLRCVVCYREHYANPTQYNHCHYKIDQDQKLTEVKLSP
jgi:hypothetical protein